MIEQQQAKLLFNKRLELTISLDLRSSTTWMRNVQQRVLSDASHF
jgi:hypothetical protein